MGAQRKNSTDSRHWNLTKDSGQLRDQTKKRASANPFNRKLGGLLRCDGEQKTLCSYQESNPVRSAHSQCQMLDTVSFAFTAWLANPTVLYKDKY